MRLARTHPTVSDDLHRLIDADEMGTLFKLLALAEPGLPAPAGLAQEYVA